MSAVLKNKPEGSGAKIIKRKAIENAKQTPSVTVQLSSVRGRVDVVQGGCIEGWLIDESNPLVPRTVAALYNGRTLTTATANRFREDLLQAKIGNGHHGFRLELPSMIPGGGEVLIVDKNTGTPLIGSPVEVGASAADQSIEADLLLVDLSDMIFYLEHHDHLSGIQRVQANIFNAIVEEALYPFSQVRVVYYKEAEQKFYELPTSFIQDLISDTRKSVTSRRYKRHSDGKLHLETQVHPKLLTLTDSQLEGSALIMLGAAWVFPSYFHAIMKLRKKGLRFVPLVHDLIPIVMPTMCDKGTAEVFKIFIRRLIRNADHIVNVSEHTRRDLINYCERLGVKCPPTSVAQNGQSLGFSGTAMKASPIHGEFVLFVSTIEGRKNHQLALRLWEELVRERGENVPTLVFVGRLGWRVEGLVEQLHESNFLNRKVVILSELSDSDLAALYQNCLFTIYPSLYEGWGLPVGESLAFGKVCLSSNASSLPEAGGDLTVYFDPNDPADAFSKLKQLIDDIPWRKSLETRISTDFQPITWASSAEKIISAVLSSSNVTAYHGPVLDVGEYNFARISYLESNIVHGEEVARHLRDFSRPNLTFRSLGLDNYILADETLGDGIWYYPEDWGRWGHIDGNSLSFGTTNPQLDYVFVFELNIPDPFLPAKLETYFRGQLVSSHTITQHKNIIRLDGKRYRNGSGYDIRFKLKDLSTKQVQGDPRQLGIGFCRLAVIEADSLAQRLEILERQIFK